MADKKQELFGRIAVDYDEPAIACDPVAFELIVESRRAVRRFSEERVPEDVMRRCLRLATLAPTSSNMQPAELYWVRSSAARPALVEALLGQPAASTAAELVVMVVPHGDWRERARENEAALRAIPGTPDSAIQYYTRIMPFVYSLGPARVWGALKGLFLGLARLFRVTPKVPMTMGDVRAISAASAGMVAQTFMLALRSHGFDSCPIGGLDEWRVRRVLGLPRSTEVLMAFGIGKRAAGGVYGPRIRRDVAKVVREV